MTSKERNKIIDDCIKVVEAHIQPNCDDHTPYYGECVSCGRYDNPDVVDDTDDLLDDLNKLKTE